MYYVCIQISVDMYLLCMIKAKSVENVITLGKLLSLLLNLNLLSNLRHAY